MPFRPFHSEPAQHRAVILPADIAAETRQKLLTRLATAVKQQAALAGREAAVLRLRGDVIDAGDRLLIPHEPVCPLIPAAAIASTDRPDIRTLQWLTWVGLRALRAAAADNLCHGGLTLGAFYRDEVGRPRIGDFGIAPALELAFGMDARRGIHCESDVSDDGHGHTLSGAWAMRPDEEHETGWIAPFFGHELTEGKVRLNPKADQFALGTLLFVLATGTHPYGAALSDPNLMFYFHVDPYNVSDERAEWKPVFERLEKGLTQAGDRPILSWWEVLQRLLASDPGERFASLADAEKQLSESIPPEWSRAWEELGQATQRLEAGDAEAALELASPWTAHEALPELWREPLGAWHARLASQKETIVRQRQAERSLREAQEALNGVDLPRARSLARALIDSPHATETIRTAAQDVLRLCDEQEQFVQSEAAPLAQAYLQAAREALGAGDVQPAREILSGVLADPATPPPLAGQAREMLAEIELSERREEQQRTDLATALQEMEDGLYDAASQRVEALLADATLPPTLSDQARELKARIDQFRRQRGEYAAALEQARTAWENSDLETLRARLSEVDPAFPDPQIADVREDLTQRAAGLHQALRVRDAALKRQEAGDHAGVIEVLRKAGRDGLPQRLLDAFAELRRAAEEAERARRQAEIDSARAQLDEAANDLARGDVDACERAVAALPDAIRALESSLSDRADALLAECESFRRAADALAGIHRDIGAKRFDSARKQLAALPAVQLPDALRPRRSQIEQELDAAYLAHLEAQQLELERRVAGCEKALADGHMDEAERLTREARQSPYLNEALSARLKRVDAEIQQLRSVQTAVDGAERELARGAQADTAAVFAVLDGLPKDLPKWLTNRADLARTKAQQVRKAQERAQRDAAIAALDAADASIASGDADEAEAALARSRDFSQRDPLLRERHEALTSSTNVLRPWLRRVEDVERKIGENDLLGAQRAASAMLKDRAVPPGARKKLEQLDAVVRERISAHRVAVDDALARLRVQLEQRGRRAKQLIPGAMDIQQDTLATEEQKAAAQELIARYEALPAPKLPIVPMIVAGALAVVGIGVGAYLMRPSGTTADPNAGRNGDANSVVVVDPNRGGSTTQPVEEDDATRLARAAAAVREHAAQWLGVQAAGIQVSFEPAGRLPTTLVVRNGERVVRRGVADRDAIADLRLTEQELQSLRTPPPPSDAEIIAAALKRLQNELAAIGGADAESARLSSSAVDRFPTTLTIERGDRRVTVEFSDRSQLDAYRITAETYARLLPDPNDRKSVEPNVPEAEIDASAYAAEVQRVLAAEATKLPGADANAVLRQVAVSATAPSENRFAISTTWAGRTLPAIDSIQFDPKGSTYSPAATDAAARLLPWMRAIAALARSDLKIASRAGYDSALELLDPLATAEVELDERGVASVAARARFRAAPSEALEVSGTLNAGVLTLDEASLRAFDERLTLIRSRQAEALPAALAEALGVPALPDGLTATAAATGDAAQLTVRAGERQLATLSAPWDPATLMFTLDGPNARKTLLDALVADLKSASESSSLRSTWPEVVAALNLPADQPGRAYLDGLVVQRIEPQGESLAELLAPLARVTLETGDGAAGDALVVTAKLTRGAQGWSWDSTGFAAISEQVSRELSRLAGDAAFRTRRATAAIGALPRERYSQIGEPKTEGDKLEVPATVSGKAAVVSWTWDPSRLDWAGRSETESAGPSNTTATPAPLEDRLAALVGEQTAARPDFGDQVANALYDIAADKASRYKTEGKYGQAAALAQGDAMSRLVRASVAAQRAAAPAPRTDPFPTVFVELWAGPQTVYAIGWRAITDGQDQINRVEGLRVRPVMPTAELARFTSPDQLRQTLASDRRLGDAILGDSLGGQPRASGGGSFGVVVAPDAAFWVIPWDQVAFTPRRIDGVDLRGAPDAGQVGRMRDILVGAQLRAGAGGFVYRRAGLWCVPSLFGEAAAGAGTVEFTLGQVIPGDNRELKSTFRKRGDAMFMLVSLPAGRDLKFGNWLQAVKQSELGYSFWNRQWEPPVGAGSVWEPTPNINFAVIQSP